jgi:hypothetical protein
VTLATTNRCAYCEGTGVEPVGGHRCLNCRGSGEVCNLCGRRDGVCECPGSVEYCRRCGIVKGYCRC